MADIGAATASLISDGSDAGFMAEVVEESRRQPVIVDFWAKWCGPCRQLTPALEKVVNAAKGAVKLVKIDVDANPRIAGQLRVQSIPTVYAFIDGQPVDGFMGALPESQLKAFVDRLSAKRGGAAPEEPSDLEALLAMAAESLSLGDVGGAAQAYAQALTLDQTNVKAIAGLARCYLAGGDADQARAILEMAPPDAKDAELDAVRAALELSAEAPDEIDPLIRRLQADEGDHEARFEVAKALAGRGDLEGAADQLLVILKADLGWNEGAARQQLLKIFEAAGPTSEVTKQGRKRLSSLLFA